MIWRGYEHRDGGEETEEGLEENHILAVEWGVGGGWRGRGCFENFRNKIKHQNETRSKTNPMSTAGVGVRL